MILHFFVLYFECVIYFMAKYFSFRRNIVRKANLSLSGLVFLPKLPYRSEPVHVFSQTPKGSYGLVECSFDNPDEKISLKVRFAHSSKKIMNFYKKINQNVPLDRWKAVLTTLLRKPCSNSHFLVSVR